MVVTPFVVEFVMRGGEWKSRCGAGREERRRFIVFSGCLQKKKKKK